MQTTTRGSIARLAATPIPVLPESKAAVGEIAGSVTLSVPRLCEVAASDPCLTLGLLRATGVPPERDADPERSAARMLGTTARHAMLLLGVERSVAVVRRLATLDAVRDPAAREGFLHALGAAHLAVHLARRWGRARGDGAAETAATAAVKEFAGDLAAWAAGGWLARVGGDDRGADAGEAIEESAVAAGRAVCARWGVPVTGAADDATGDLRAAALGELAARLARAASRDWYSEATRLGARRLAQHLGGDADALLAEARREAAAAARSFPRGAYVAAARALPLPPGERIETPRLRMPARAAVPEPPAAPQLEGDAAAESWRPASADAAPGAAPGEPARPAVAPVDACLGRIDALAGSSADLRTGLRTVVDSMHANLGLHRVAFAMRGSDRRELVGRFAAGAGAEALRRALHVPLGERSVFTRLLERERAVRAGAGDADRLWRSMPAALRGEVRPDGFAAMSLFVRGKAVGVLCTDGAPDSGPLGDAAYDDFKRVCKALARLLETLAATSAA